jgi:hypothetical protein
MSKNLAQFIDCDYVKENTIIEYNVDDAKIQPIILKAQQIYIQQALGSYFYDYLCTGIVSGTTSTTERNLIIDYIQPALNEAVLYEALPFINYKATNKAVVKQNSDNSTASDLSEIKYLRQGVKDMMDFYIKRLNKYLIDNSTLFPQYENPTSPENVERNSKSYFNGLYLSGRRNLGSIPTNRDIRDCDNC